jgi:hypothetical protein
MNGYLDAGLREWFGKLAILFHLGKHLDPHPFLLPDVGILMSETFSLLWDSCPVMQYS